MESNQNLLNNDLQVETDAYTSLRETGIWARFLGILGMIVSTFVVLAGFVVGPMLSRMGDMAQQNPLFMLGSVGITIFYLALGALGFFISWQCYKFGTNSKNAIQTGDNQSLTASFYNLKLLFRVQGIIAILYILFIIVAIIFGGMNAMNSFPK